MSSLQIKSSCPPFHTESIIFDQNMITPKFCIRFKNFPSTIQARPDCCFNSHSGKTVKFQINKLIIHDSKAVYSRACRAMRHELRHMQSLHRLHAWGATAKRQSDLLRGMPSQSQKLLHQEKLQKTNAAASPVLLRMRRYAMQEPHSP